MAPIFVATHWYFLPNMDAFCYRRLIINTPNPSQYVSLFPYNSDFFARHWYFLLHIWCFCYRLVSFATHRCFCYTLIVLLHMHHNQHPKPFTIRIPMSVGVRCLLMHIPAFATHWCFCYTVIVLLHMHHKQHPETFTIRSPISVGVRFLLIHMDAFCYTLMFLLHIDCFATHAS